MVQSMLMMSGEEISCADNQIHILKISSMEIMRSISGIKPPLSSQEICESISSQAAVDRSSGLMALQTDNYGIQFYSLFANRRLYECLLKLPVEESTKPIDVKLHSDSRAIGRAEFYRRVSEKLSLIEQQKMELERQQKLAEEEEIRRLRKEVIPKAQPMPYFDRPFIPRRSMKNPTIPKESKFHIPHHKKIKCLTLNEMRSYSSCFN